MIIDPQRIYDGTVSWAGGQDAGRNPVLLNDDQYQEGENVVCRGGEISPRPAYRLKTLNFTNNITYTSDGGHSGSTPVGSQAAFQQGLFQGALFYDPSINVDSIVCSIGGRIFQLVPRRTTVDVIELYLDQQNRANIPIAYMV